MSRQVRVGLLVVAGLLLFFVALFAIANRSFLFSDTFFINSDFESVAGLQPGAPVQFQGVRVGRVEAVQLPEAPGRPITVQLAIKKEAQRLIHENTQAHIKSAGLLGNQIIVLINPAGTLAETVESGDTIPGVEPFDPFEIADRALASVQTFEEVALDAQEIMQGIQQGEGSLGKFIYDPSLYNSLVATADESQRVMNELGNDAEAITRLAEEATASVQSILAKVNQGDGTLARLLNDPAVYNTLLATADTLQSVSADVRDITTSAENAANWGALGMYRLAELMEAAKHNWLFKRYFEERGYMEKAPFEVREAAIEETYQELEERSRALYEWEQRLEQRAAELEAASADSALATPRTGPEDTEESGSRSPSGLRNR